MVLQRPNSDLSKCGYHFHHLFFLVCGQVIGLDQYNLDLNAQVVQIQFRQLSLNSVRQESLMGSPSNNVIV